MKLFQKLNDKEKEESKKWARDNYTPMSEIKGIWHPEVQKECVQMNIEEGQAPWFVALQEACDILPDVEHNSIEEHTK